MDGIITGLNYSPGMMVSSVFNPDSRRLSRMMAATATPKRQTNFLKRMMIQWMLPVRGEASDEASEVTHPGRMNRNFYSFISLKWFQVLEPWIYGALECL